MSSDLISYDGRAFRITSPEGFKLSVRSETGLSSIALQSVSGAYTVRSLDRAASSSPGLAIPCADGERHVILPKYGGSSIIVTPNPGTAREKIRYSDTPSHMFLVIKESTGREIDPSVIEAAVAGEPLSKEVVGAFKEAFEAGKAARRARRKSA